MRFTDMNYLHPDQNDTRKCDRCGHQVGIYPSGQDFLKIHPNAMIICTQCADHPIPMDAPSNQIRREMTESHKRDLFK
jgi:hypothetical protein